MRGAKHRKSVCSVVITALLVVQAAAAQPGGGGGPPPARVRVDAARLEPIDQLREVTGDLRAAKRSRVAAREPGLVLALEVDIGSLVKKGDVLARLDVELLELQIQSQSAEVESKAALASSYDSELEKANRNLARRKTILDQGGATDNEVDDAATDARAAQAKLAEARADLTSAKAALEWWRRRVADGVIRAPFAGTVVAKSTEVGEWVREGDTVVEIVALDEIDVYLDVPQRFLPAVLAAGTSLQVRIEAFNEVVEAREAAIIPDGDAMSRTFEVKLRLPNPDGRLKPGMSVVGLVPTGESAQSLTIHKDAVLRNDAGPFVYFNAGGMALPAPIEPLFGVGDRMVIKPGRIQPGMPVIVEGNERVFPSQPLMVVDDTGQVIAPPAGPGGPGGAGGPAAGGAGKPEGGGPSGEQAKKPEASPGASKENR